ncbi:MAG: sensor histidine kinase [Xanthobacteraceae bacterium]|jgi:two-component sensor histidine kinase
MSRSILRPPGTPLYFPRRPRPKAAIDAVEQRQRAALTDELHASLARESAWRQEYADAMQRQAVQAREFEHRVFNGLQLVVSTLVLQSLTAAPETAAPLAIAAGRIAAIAHVHQQLHSVDGQENVDFKDYLERLCESLSDLVFGERPGHAIGVRCGSLELSTALGLRLGLIVNELVTNSVKYAKGNVAVRVEEALPLTHSLSVSDDGPGFPSEFDPAQSRGLGMKIVLSLVKEIGGELHIFPGDDGCGTRFTVTFRASEAAADLANAGDRAGKQRHGEGYDGVLFLHTGRNHAAASPENLPADQSQSSGD